MADLEGFANRVFLLRKSAVKSQEEVGTALGLTKSGVSSFEKGKSIPSPENLVKLAALFGVTVDYLLTGHSNTIGREGDKNLPNYPATHSTQSSIERLKVTAPSNHNPVEELNRHLSTVEDALNKTRTLFEQVLAKSQVRQLSIVVEYNDQAKANSLSSSPYTTLPDFDQAQIDKRFLTELDRLLKDKVFLTYTAWAQAVDVSPNYVAAIERGRYHFNIELLYRTARRFPNFDFIYVLFGSALSARPEPTELPKRGRGRPKESDFRERLKEIIINYKLAEHGMWAGDYVDLANDKKVYELYVSEYGPIKDGAKYLHEMELITDSIINEIKDESGSIS